jgi:transcriptional regulator with XRE-family HTH domain
MDPVPKLRTLRKRRGLSQEGLAKLAGTTQYTISEIELGHRDPHPATLEKLAGALGVAITDLFTEEPADPKAAAPSHSEESVAGSRGEGRLARLATYSGGILEIVKELDPANNQLDRVAVDLIEAQVREITRVLTEKTSVDLDNPLAGRLRDQLDTAGEETEMVLGGGAPPAKTTHGESEQSQTTEAHEAPREA